MGRRHKRKHVEYSDDNEERSGQPEEHHGVGAFLTELKKATPHKFLSEGTLSINPTSTDATTQNGDHNVQQWHKVARKSGSNSKREQARGKQEAVKYPELNRRGTIAVPIRIADLQALTLYTLADGVAPNWVAFKHAHQTKKVVVLMVPGLEMGMFDGTASFQGDLDPQTTERAMESSESNRGSDQQEQPPKESPARKSGGAAIRPLESRLGNPIKIAEGSIAKCLQPLIDIFEEVWPVRAPGDSRCLKLHSPIQAMLTSPLPQSKENKAIKGPKPPAEEKTWQAQRTPIVDFIHTVDELRDADYPLHPTSFNGDKEAALLEQERRNRTGQNGDGGWLDSKISADVDCIVPDQSIEQGSITSGRQVYAVDCEMVLTTDDKYSLARISIIDWGGAIILDELVKPNLPIKNYYTQFSGMTRAILDPVKTSLADIQSQLLKLFTPQTVLLGHSLESDLAAMKMTHPFIVDTSIIYPHPRGPPLRSSLKFLAQKYLRRDIQRPELTGHNSVEDALAVLDLVKLKCEKGPKWGTSAAAGEPLFRRLARSRKKDANGNERGITSAVVDYGAPERGYGKEATVKIGCDNDEAVVQAVKRAVNGDDDGKLVPGGGVDFTWARLRELERFCGWSNNNRDHATADKSQVGEAPSAEAAVREEKEHGGQAASLSPDDTLPISTKDNTEQATDPPPYTTDHISTTPPPHPPTPAPSSALSATASHIASIHSALPPCTLFIVYTGTGDPRPVGRLQQMQQQFRKEFKVKKWDDLSIRWTDDEEQALRKAVEEARRGVGFLCVT